tara:strand:- start:332 stop:1078 length:747 start_codon:yes stop_codon:yes gene_type:complete
MNVLELFSGTHSVGKCCEELGWNAISVDNELPATHKCDIMTFDYTIYPKDYFSVVWCSPPCTDYSHLQHGWLGRKKKDGNIYTKEIMEQNMINADKLVLKSLEIIKYFNPEVWFLENPQTGRLKNRDIMKDIPFYDVDYCKYSDWGYRKRTRIWTNKKDWIPKICKKDCENMITIDNPDKTKKRYLHKTNCGNTEKLQAIRKHKCSVSDVHSNETMKHSKDLSNVGNGTNRLDRYRIPPDLIYSLFLD